MGIGALILLDTGNFGVGVGIGAVGGVGDSFLVQTMF